MIRFCGQDQRLVDANGRIKLSPSFEQELRKTGAVEVMLHCLPEGALAVYPLHVWEEMRAADATVAVKAVSSYITRSQLRRFGAMTQVEKLSNQGRLTIPPMFRGAVQLEPGTVAVVVGCEIGMEIWNAERWRQELQALQEHGQLRKDAELKADVAALSMECERREKGMP